MPTNAGIEPKNDTLEGFERIYEYTVCLHRQYLPQSHGGGDYE